jgi:hypothetical protein
VNAGAFGLVNPEKLAVFLAKADLMSRGEYKKLWELSDFV